jgi:DNA-binding transcriptional LysR family regulator
VVGREFLPQARSIVGEMTSAVERLKDMSQRSTGNFTLACIPSMTSHVLPGVIRQYAKAHPDNRIRLLDGSSDEVRTAVLGGQAELGIAVQGEKHPDLAETVLFADPLVFVCRTPHPLQERKSVTWSDMRDTDLVGVSSFVATRLTMDYQLAKRNIRVHVKYEVQHHATAVNLVAAGVASAILPSSTIREGRPSRHPQDRPGRPDGEAPGGAAARSARQPVAGGRGVPCPDPQGEARGLSTYAPTAIVAPFFSFPRTIPAQHNPPVPNPGGVLSMRTDVLVIGGGNAALCAALMAAEAGASVLLLEAAPREWRGGNSMHTRNLRCMHDAPQDVLVDAYPEEEYWQDLLKVTGGLTDEHLARLTIRASSTCRDWMRSTACASSRRCPARCTWRAPMPSSWAAARRWSTPTTAVRRSWACASATKHRWTASRSRTAASSPPGCRASASRRGPACWPPAASNPTSPGCARPGAETSAANGRPTTS